MANQFTLPAVKITGGILDEGIDINSNGLFDTLIISVNIESLVPGTYTAAAWLMGENGENITYAQTKTAYDIGSYSTTLKFSGIEINKSQLNGPYKIGYSVIRDSSKVLFSNSDIYTTKSYNASQFEQEKGKIISSTGRYSENIIDSDSDELIDTLIIEVEVVPRDSGNIVAIGRLVDSKGETILWSSTNDYLTKSNPQMLHIKFDGRYIYGGLVNGPYHLTDLQIYHTGEPTETIDISDAYTTKFYYYNNFETAGVATGNISDNAGNPVKNVFLIIQSIDNDYSDVDGKYNLVVLNSGEYEVKIKGPDTLKLNWSISLDGNYLTSGDSVKVNIDLNQIAKLDFKAPVILTEVDEKSHDKFIPNLFILRQNFPNPFNPSTIIEYQIPAGTFVTIKVYDSIGREVATLVNKQQEAGYYQVRFNAQNIASGIYFCRIVTDNYTAVRKMQLLK